MIRIIRTIAAGAVLVLLLGVPALASAHSDGMPFPYFGQGGLLSCTGGTESINGPSNLPPCRSICDLLHTGQHVLYFMMSLALFIIAPLMLAWGGLQLMISMGSVEKIESGRRLLKTAVLGIVLILCAFLIVNTFFYLAATMANQNGGGTDAEGHSTGVSLQNIRWSNIQCQGASGEAVGVEGTGETNPGSAEPGGGTFGGGGATGGW